MISRNEHHIAVRHRGRTIRLVHRLSITPALPFDYGVGARKQPLDFRSGLVVAVRSHSVTVGKQRKLDRPKIGGFLVMRVEVKMPAITPAVEGLIIYISEFEEARVISVVRVVICSAVPIHAVAAVGAIDTQLILLLFCEPPTRSVIYEVGIDFASKGSPNEHNIEGVDPLAAIRPPIMTVLVVAIDALRRDVRRKQPAHCSRAHQGEHRQAGQSLKRVITHGTRK